MGAQASVSTHLPEAYPRAVETPVAKLEVSDSSLLPHERVRQDGSGFSRILSVMGEPCPQTPEERRPPAAAKVPDIDDEERFLYGDEGTGPTQPCPQNIPVKPAADGQTSAPATPLQQFKALLGDPGMSHIFRQAQSALSLTVLNQGAQEKHSATPEVKPEALAPRPRAGSLDKQNREGTPSSAEFERVKSLLKNMGLSLSTAEINKIAVKLRDTPKLRDPKSTPSKSSHESSHSSVKGEKVLQLCCY